MCLFPALHRASGSYGENDRVGKCTTSQTRQPGFFLTSDGHAVTWAFCDGRAPEPSCAQTRVPLAASGCGAAVRHAPPLTWCSPVARRMPCTRSQCVRPRCPVLVLPRKDTCPWVRRSCVFASRFSVSVAVSGRSDQCSARSLLGRVTRPRGLREKPLLEWPPVCAPRGWRFGASSASPGPAAATGSRSCADECAGCPPIPCGVFL